MANALPITTQPAGNTADLLDLASTRLVSAQSIVDIITETHEKQTDEPLTRSQLLALYGADLLIASALEAIEQAAKAASK